MTIEFILPDIGEGIVECELLEWLVSEGEHIEEDQPVAEVMTDKATVQIPAMHAGVVNKLHYAVGDIAKVHAPLFSMTPDDAVVNEEPQAKVPEKPTKETTSDNVKNDELPVAAARGKHIEDFILPDIGEGIVECEIVRWNVAEGDVIEEDQAVVEVMTDKAVVEIPAKNAGTVHRLYYAQGDIAKVHSALFALEVAGEVTTTSGTNDESPSVNNSASSVASQSSMNTQTNGASQQSAQVAPSKFSDGEYEPPIAIEGKVLASPAVRRVAREKNIDLSTVEGSGKKGRILKSDVLNLQHSNVDTSSQNLQAIHIGAR